MASNTGIFPLKFETLHTKDKTSFRELRQASHVSYSRSNNQSVACGSTVEIELFSSRVRKMTCLLQLRQEC